MFPLTTEKFAIIYFHRHSSRAWHGRSPCIKHLPYFSRMLFRDIYV